MLTRNIVKKVGSASIGVGYLCANTREAISQALAVLVGGVLEETMTKAVSECTVLGHSSLFKINSRGGLGSLQESLSANLALDAHGFLILRLSVT
jgi:rhamnogalacturonyl hydrolase YesR